MKSNNTHVIFDLDGTLFDTEFEVSRLTQKLAAERGCVMSAEDVHRQCAGYSSREKFSMIAAACGKSFSEEELAELSVQHEINKKQIYQRATIPVMPGAEKLLADLDSRGYGLSVATSNPEAVSKQAVVKTGLSAYFNDRVFGSDSSPSGRKKPDPAVYLTAMAGAAPARFVAVEDSEAGILAAKRAGCDVIIALLDPRYGDDSQCADKIASYRNAGANTIIHGFNEFMPALDALSAPKRTPRAPKP